MTQDRDHRNIHTNPFISPEEADAYRKDKLDKELLSRKLNLIDNINNALYNSHGLKWVLSKLDYKILNAENLFACLREKGWNVTITELGDDEHGLCIDAGLDLQ